MRKKDLAISPKKFTRMFEYLIILLLNKKVNKVYLIQIVRNKYLFESNNFHLSLLNSNKNYFKHLLLKISIY